MRLKSTICLAFYLFGPMLLHAQGRIISTFPHSQSFSFVPAGTSATPNGPIGTPVFPSTDTTGGEMTVDGTTGSNYVSATTTGLNNAGGAGGALRVQTSGTGSPTNVQGFLVYCDFTGRTAGVASIAWQKVQNGTSTRRNELHIAASADGGSFADLGSVWFDNSTTAQSGTLSVTLPSSLDGISDVRIWVYSVNVSGSGAHPRVLVDDLSITAPPESPLPVELASFEVSWRGTPELQWRTASETGVTGFEIERSEGDTDFILIASWRSDAALRALGTSATGRAYVWRDDLPQALAGSGAILRYRITSVEHDGTRNHLATRLLRIPGGTRSDTVVLPQLALGLPWPQPSTGDLTIPFSLAESGDASLRIYDIEGRLEREIVLGHLMRGRHTASFDVRELTPGVYALTIETAGGMRARPFIIGR